MSRAAIDDQYAIMLESVTRKNIWSCATHSLLSSPRGRGPITTKLSMSHPPCRIDSTRSMGPPFARTTAVGGALLHHQLLLANDLRPGRGLGLDVVAELLGRCRHRFEQLRCHEFLLERWIAQDLPHLGVDL